MYPRKQDPSAPWEQEIGNEAGNTSFASMKASDAIANL